MSRDRRRAKVAIAFAGLLGGAVATQLPGGAIVVAALVAVVLAVVQQALP